MVFYVSFRRRKAAWQALNPDTIPNDFEDSIIAEALEDVHFNCVVEVNPDSSLSPIFSSCNKCRSYMQYVVRMANRAFM